MFTFEQDRKPQGTISGPFAPLADQSRFRSIYGVVDGPMGPGAFSAQDIEEGKVFSADGKGRLGGTAFQKGGKFHDVKVGQTTFREYQVPVESVEKWNAYEGRQGNEMAKRWEANERTKAMRGGFAEVEVSHETFEDTGVPQYDPAPAPARSPEQIAAAQARMAKARAARKIKSSAVQP